MSAPLRLISPLLAGLFFLLSPHALSQDPVPETPPAEVPSPSLQTVDPSIGTETLGLLLDPMTQDEIAKEIEAWMSLLKAKATEVSQAEIAAQNPENPDRKAIMDGLPALREEKNDIIDRFEVVLKSYEVKGGDPSKERKYAAAVAGIKASPRDVESFLSNLRGWIFSRDGGIHWGIALLQFVGIMVVAFFLAAGVARLTERALEKGAHLSGLLRNFIKTWIRRVIIFLGLIVALGTVGVNVGAAFALIGGGAFILGFALQDTLGNLANGLMLLINRPFDVGDAVEVGGVSGSVDSVSLVNTTIRTWDNKKVLVPNKQVWGQTITNITGMPTRRVDMVFGIGYDDDVDKAMEILRQVVTEHELTLEQPAPQVELHELGDSSVNLICRPWAKTSDYWRLHWDVTKRVKKEFDAAGISIPFPQRDVHVYQETPPPAEPVREAEEKEG